MIDTILFELAKKLASLAADKINEKVTLLLGVEEEAEKLLRKLRNIRLVLANAEERALTDGLVRVWLDDLRDIIYDIEDVLDDWTLELEVVARGKGESSHGRDHEGGTDFEEKKACFPSCIPTPSCFKKIKQVKSRHDIAKRIEVINGKLDDIATLKQQYHLETTEYAIDRPSPTTSFGQFMPSNAQTTTKQKVIAKLLDQGQSSDGDNRIPVISLVGMGGIGKTTIARMVYNDAQVKNQFDKLIWVCVSDIFDKIKVAKEIAASLGSDRASNLSGLQLVLEEIQRCVTEKRYFLVLDDVWTEGNENWDDIFDSLATCSRGSAVLLTTRKDPVATKLKTSFRVSVDVLPEGECLSLFKYFAFWEKTESKRRELEGVAAEMARRCKGLPLAAEILGKAMLSKSTRLDWERVLESSLWNFEDKNNGLLPALSLSYLDLPSQIKRCFAACSIFPKDTVMLKEELVRIWMALGFLGSESHQSKSMESVGEDYYDTLLSRSFFQKYSSSVVKMHDIVHDFAQFLMKKETMVYTGDDKAVNEELSKIRHLNIAVTQFQLSTLNIDSQNDLRALLMKAPDGLLKLANFPCLRVLRMSNVEENLVLKGIENLTHLRYIDFSVCDGLKELPESICDLFFLQTLDVSHCYSLQKLPKGIGKLINLRHLENLGEGLSSLPKGISRLSSLQTLPWCPVGGGQPAHDEILQLGDLQNLNKLRGRFFIDGINDSNKVEEAEKAGLQHKKDLVELRLIYDDEVEQRDEAGTIPIHRLQVLEALKPHDNLESLGLLGYMGNSYARWMSTINLKQIVLNSCYPSFLPPLGRLPHLEWLYIQLMDQVKSVGDEFLGIEEMGHAASQQVAFPALKALQFSDLREWETWVEPQHGSNKDIQFAIMPSLSHLSIYRCQKLKALPRFLAAAPIQKLYIANCPLIKNSIEDGCEECHWISNIQDLLII